MLIGARLALASENCACAADPPFPDSELLYCRSVGDPHYTTFGNQKFDFMGTGVFSLASTAGGCDCSTHDDVEVQTFMCGTQAWRKQASTNAAVAVRADGVTLVIDAVDDSLTVSGGGQDTIVAPSSADIAYSFGVSGAVAVAREQGRLKGQMRWQWRISFPGGGSLLSMRWPSTRLDSGAMLQLWTSLPQSTSKSGLCERPCSTLPPPACGAFSEGVEYVGGNVGSCSNAVASAFDCAHSCWETHRASHPELRFTWHAQEQSCCCHEEGAATSASAAATPPVSGTACKKPCPVEGDHCTHVKEEAALFDQATRTRLQATCGLAESVRPNEEPNCSEGCKPIHCNSMSVNKWVRTSSPESAATDYRIISHGGAKSPILTSSDINGACVEWCEQLVLQPNDDLIGNYWRDHANVCTLKSSLVGGTRVRCGLDINQGRCSLFVGNDISQQNGLSNKYRATTSDCLIDLECVDECTPEQEDVCEGTGVPLAEAQAACVNLTRDESLAQEYRDCVFDYCATDGDPEVPPLHEEIPGIDGEEVINRPPAVPSPAPPPAAPLLPLQPKQCVVLTDGSTHCLAIPEGTSLADESFQRRLESLFGARACAVDATRKPLPGALSGGVAGPSPPAECPLR